MDKFKQFPFLSVGNNFPAYHLPKSIWRTAVSFQRITQAPGELIVNSMISVISTTFQGHYGVKGLNGSSIPISTYMLAISPSGEGKTVVQKIVGKPLAEFSAILEKTSAMDIDEWESAIAEWTIIHEKMTAKKARLLADQKDTDELDKAITEHKTKKPIKPTAKRLISSDPSPAGLKTWLASGLGCGLVQNSDSGKMINGPLLQEAPLLCDIWSGENITVDRGNFSLSVTEPRVSMSLMTQPNFLDELLRKNGDQFRGSGLGGRILTYQPLSRIGERRFGTILDDDDEVALQSFYDRITERLTALYGDDDHANNRIQLNLNQDARYFLVNLSQDIERQMAPGGNLSYMTEFASKFVEHTCRFAALYTLFEGTEADGISLQTVQMATELTHYFAGEYSRIHSPWVGPIRDFIQANDLLKFLVEKTRFGMYQIPRTTIIQNARSTLRNKELLDNALSVLINYGKISINQLPGKRAGTCRMAYSVTDPNPILF